MFQRIRPLSVQTVRKFCARHRLLEGKPCSMSIGRIKLFKESMTTVRVTDEELEEADEEGVFASDEKPHFLQTRTRVWIQPS